MIYEFTYTLDSIMSDLKRDTQREAITIPQLPRDQGYITQDVQPVIAVIENKDRSLIKASLSDAAANIWPFVVAWIHEEGLNVPEIPQDDDEEGNPVPPIEGIFMRFRKDEVLDNRVPIITNLLQEAIRHSILSDWYKIYLHRHDIYERYITSFIAKGESLRSNLIKNKAKRPYRFF